MIYLYALLVKHVIVDLGLQSYLQNQNKYPYIGSGHMHYIQHGVATGLVSLFFIPELAIFVGMLDYLLHWHIDFSKHRFNAFFKIQSRTKVWWWINVVDQILHFTTYLAFALLFSA